MPAVNELLAELEDRYILGELLESAYKEMKWKLLKEAHARGEAVTPFPGKVQRAEARDSLGKVFCYVDAGPFIYGPSGDYAEIKSPYYVSRFPVTVKDFLAFLEDAKHPFPEEDLAQLLLVCPDHKCPVSHVSWEDAKEYCRWLRRVSNEYYSLPHELEWEKAARGVDGRLYPWGNQEPTHEQACFAGERLYESTMPVTSYPANRSPYGCMEMVGNVWEWCLDNVDDARQPHILRGGSWCNTVDYCNCVARTFSFPPTKRQDFCGFRVIYLPQDMYADYRREYGNEGAAQKKMSLRVVRMGKGAVMPTQTTPAWEPAAAAPEAPAEPGTSTLSGLAIKLQKAAARADATQQAEQAQAGADLAASIEELTGQDRATQNLLDEARQQLLAARGQGVAPLTTAAADALSQSQEQVPVPLPGTQELPGGIKPRSLREVRRVDDNKPAAVPEFTDEETPSAATVARNAQAASDSGELDELMAEAISGAAEQFLKGRQISKESLPDRLARLKAEAAAAAPEEVSHEVESETKAPGKPKRRGEIEYDALALFESSYKPVEYPPWALYLAVGVWGALVLAILFLLFMRYIGI